MCEIAPGVFVHIGAVAMMTKDNEGAIANVGFVIGDDAVAVIDTGGSVREGKRLLAAVRVRTGKPIRYVISTHAHPDHVFGHAALENEGAAYVGHRNLARALAMRGPFYLEANRRSMGDEIMGPVKLIPPTRLIADEERLELGGRSLALKAWPVAHTDNDLTVLDEKTATLFAGDLIVTKHIPVLDGSLLGWLTALDGLERIHAKRVLPGHGPAVDDWHDALNRQRRYLERLAGDMRALIARGTTLPDAVASATAAYEKDQWSLFQDYHARNATAAFAELEWE